MTFFLEGLNSEQRDCVLHEGGPLLVLAGPGSGKTRVITARLAHRLASSQVKAERALAITFTGAAASEMKRRLTMMLGANAVPQTGTFHGMCHAILRRFGDRAGLQRGFRLLPPSDSRRIFRRLLAAMEVDPAAMSGMMQAVSAGKNGASIDDVVRRYGTDAGLLRVLSRRYQRELRESRSLDLDDLLAISCRLLQTSPSTRSRCQGWYDEILVDEYQDVNPVQRRLLQLLRPSSGCLTAVGDDDQAIYGWREASSDAILRFESDFSDVTVITLGETFRSTKRILRASATLISHNAARRGKSLRTDNPAGNLPVCLVAKDETDEAEWVSHEITRGVEREGRAWSDFGVLYRLNAQARPFEDAFLRMGVPYRIRGGSKFYERPEIRRAVSYLCLVVDANDDSAALSLLQEVRGLGIVRLEEIRRQAAGSGTAISRLLQSGHALAGVPHRARAEISELGRNMQTAWQTREKSLEQAVRTVARIVEQEMKRQGADGVAVQECLEELVSIAVESQQRRSTLRAFVDSASPRRAPDKDDSVVSCMSLHAAKGTEFHTVFLAGVEEGLLPYKRALERSVGLEEERRLCYVGITRAKEALYLTYARARRLGGRHYAGGPSRFIAEIEQDNLSLRVSQRESTRPTLWVVNSGDRVTHFEWGNGTVTAVEGSGQQAFVTVVFDTGGKRRFQLRHTPLQRICGGPYAKRV